MDLITLALARKYTNSVALNGVAVRYPYIDGLSKNWMVFNSVANEWQDSGVLAEGKSPYIDTTTGTWFIWVNGVPTDSGIAASVSSDAKNTLITDPIVCSTTVGGYKPGDTVLGTDSVWDVVKKLLNPVQKPSYVAPVLSINASLPTARNFEIGTFIEPHIVPAYQINDGGALTNYSLSKNGTLIYSDSSATAYTDPEYQITSTVTYVASGTHLAGPIKNDSEGQPSPEGSIQASTKTSNSLVFNAYRMGFYGVLSDTTIPNTSAIIRALPNTLLNPSPGNTMQVYIPPGGRGCVFAYPQNVKFPASIIQQGLNMDVKNSMIEIIVNVSSNNNFDEIPYRVIYVLPEFPYGGDGETFTLTI